MDKLPNYQSATSGVLIGALIALILYIVGCELLELYKNITI